MQLLVHRVLGLTPRELSRAVPLFLYLFLAIAGSVASKATRDALFLDLFDATDLPYVDIAIAILVGLVAGVYIRIGQRTNVRNIQIGSLLAFAASAVMFWLLADDRSGPVLVIIYVWVGVLSVLLPSQVWTLANYVLTTREAKRAFGFIGSGAILGWIAGGFATREAVNRFGTESMLLWLAVVLVLAAGIVWFIWRERPRYGWDSGDAIGDASGEEPRGGFFASLTLVRDSRYLTAIALVIGFAALVTSIAGWQFKAIAKANIPDTDELAMFFGTFNMVAGLAAFLLQLVLTGRLLRSAGVGVALFIVPVALTLSSVGLLIVGTLVAVIAVKASDQVLRYSIDKATVELLYLPVSSAVTFRVKSFIDTAVYRMGDAVGGLAVLLFARYLGLSPVQISLVVLLLLSGWFWAAWVARREYVENLRESIHQHRVDTERARAPVMEREASNLIAEQLEGNPAEILYALSLFEMADDRAVHPAVRGLLRHEAPAVRVQAIRLLARAGDTAVLPDIERLLYDNELEVRTEALLYVTEHAHVDPLERIEQLGGFQDFSIRAAMVAFLARAENVEAAQAILAAMVAEAGDEGRRTRLEAARLIAWLPDRFDKDLKALVQDPDARVAAAAIQSAGRLKKRALASRIVERLGEDPDLTDAGIETLSGLGDAIVGTLRDALIDESTPLEARREIPAVLQAIGSRASHYALLETVLAGDTVLRYRVITALNKLGQLYPDRRLDRRIVETVLGAEVMGHYRSYQVLSTLEVPSSTAAPSGQKAPGGKKTVDPVAQGLRKSIQHESERIFRLLKILYPNHDLHSAYVGLQSADPVVHDNAIEFLDTILSPQLRALLIPLFDRDVSVAERGRLAARLVGTGMGDRDEAIAVMTLSDDPWLQSCAAYAIGEFRMTRFAASLEAWCRAADPLLRATAQDAQRKLGRPAPA